MSTTEAQTLAEMIDEINDRDVLAVVERAVVRTRMRIGEAERAALEADPAEQERRRKILAEYHEEAAQEEQSWERKRASREARLANADVLGTFTFERIRPKYLVGKTVPVTAVNEATYRCNVPDSPEFKTWAGRNGIRVPKSSGTFVLGGEV